MCFNIFRGIHLKIFIFNSIFIYIKSRTIFNISLDSWYGTILIEADSGSIFFSIITTIKNNMANKIVSKHDIFYTGRENPATRNGSVIYK